MNNIFIWILIYNMNKMQLDMFLYVARNVICSISAAFGHLGKNINVLHDVTLRNEEM